MYLRTSREKRRGNGYTWESTRLSHNGVESSRKGFTVDNLDTKTLDQAEDRFEKIFILTREVLENYDSLDDKYLDICHQVARHLSKNYRKIEN